MIININSDAESSTQGIETSLMAFDFDKQAKLFHMLSSSLYSNKLGSILRELASNGRDAMVEAGEPSTPFHVVGPTYENPELVVKDFGVGLTKERAKRTILMYLGSSKDQSAEFIGGWGIGSKSPFAYAKNYTVICVKDGKLVEFACWKDDKGLPRDAVIREEDTEAPNGVEMRVPIEASDVRKCNNVIRDYMSWTNYEIIATINGDVIEKRKPAEELVTDEYTLRLYKEGSGSVRLVYGGASYDIDDCIDQRFDLAERWKELKEKMDKTVDLAVVIDTPGAVDFNMNREELEQTERTQAFVNTFVSYLLDVGDAQRLTYEQSLVETRAGKTEEANLASVEKAIAAALEEKENVDRIFSMAFLIFDKKLRYAFKSPMRRITWRSGVQKAHALEYLVIPLAQQIDVAWGRHYSPRPTYRYPVDPSKTKKEHIYVKAESEAEARALLEATPDFDGFDVSTLNFIHIDIPVPVRAPATANNRQANPRPYDRVKKAYVKWDDFKTYVILTGEVDVADIEYCKMSASAPGRIAAFTPTPEFIKRHGGLDNVMTDVEFYEKYFESAVETVHEWGGFSEEQIKRLEKLSDKASRVAWSANVPRRLIKQGEDTRCMGREICDNLRRFADAKLPDDSIPESPHYRVLRIALVRLLWEVRRVGRVAEYVNFDKLLRNRRRKSAVDLIASLKIEEWI